MSLTFRPLMANETECRIQQVKQKYISLLIYKNARVDMEILDETVGVENWQREHYECKGNLFCKVGINVNYDKPNKEPLWVWKSDCGSESNMEKEKGESSDSFKRSCVCFGIGRELYTAPQIYIKAKSCHIEPTNRKDKNGNTVYTCRDNFAVKTLIVENKKIVSLTIARYDFELNQWVNVFTYDKRNL